MMKNLIKIVAMLSFMFLFTGCDYIEDKIKSEIKESEEIKSLKSKIDNLESKIDNLENPMEKQKKQKKQKEQIRNMLR